MGINDKKLTLQDTLIINNHNSNTSAMLQCDKASPTFDLFS